jgi:hypothetical protein
MIAIIRRAHAHWTSDNDSRTVATGDPLVLLNRIPAKRLCSNIGDRHLVDLVSVLVDDDDEPASPVPARHDRAVFEIACERQRVLARGGIAGQLNTFVIIQNLFAVGEMEIVTRHG